MPANLTPQYFDAEERYRKATTDRERLDALHEMLKTIPKHKGTEKLQADLKKKIKALKTGGGKKGGARRAAMHTVERSGAAQIAIVGPPNSGKSRLVAELTAADPEVAEYPFTTRTPTPGIALAEQIPLQLVDLPPITGDYWCEGPTAFKIDDTWHVYFDRYRDNTYGLITSRDLKTWTERTADLNMPKGTRHGTIFRVSDEILNGLISAQG